MSPGQVIVGFSLSVTTTSKLHVAVLLLASVTTNVLVVVPTGNTLPLGKPAVCTVDDCTVVGSYRCRIGYRRSAYARIGVHHYRSRTGDRRILIIVIPHQSCMSLYYHLHPLQQTYWSSFLQGTLCHLANRLSVLLLTAQLSVPTGAV